MNFDIIEMLFYQGFQTKLNYDALDQFKYLSTTLGFEIDTIDYGVVLTVNFYVDKEKSAQVLNSLEEYFNNQLQIHEIESKYIKKTD